MTSMIRTTSVAVLCCLAFAMGGCQSSSTASASPGCPDNHEHGAAAKAAGEAKLVKVVNTRCPIAPDDEVGDGGLVDAELTRVYKGQTVGFCCPNCPPLWDKMSDAKKDAALKNAASKGTSRS